MKVISSKKMSRVIVLLGILTLTLGVASEETESEFNNDRRLIEEETGGILRLKSRGKLTKIVDLDSTEVVKRILCRGDTVLVALKKDVQPITWQSGQLVISKLWPCNTNVNNPEPYTVYAIVEDVRRPKEYYIELLTREAGPLDMLEEASIQVHYEQGTKAPLRQKRFISKGLDSIDWNTSFVSDIPFNERDSMVDKPINVHKMKGDPDLPIDTAENVPSTNETQFLFQCVSCHAHSQISYVFELKVKKVDKKPQVQKYMMQLEVDTTIEQRYSIDVEEELSLTRSAMLWRQEPSTIFETNLVEFKKLEPVKLRVVYTGQANLELVSRTRNRTHYTGEFAARGNTVITQTFESGQPNINEVTSYNWTLLSNNVEYLDANSSVNATFAVFQNMTLAPAVSWAQRDVDFNLGPPIKLSIRPRVNVISTSDGTVRCGASSVSVDTNVSVAETDFSFDAFGFKAFHNWSVLLMDELSKRMDVLNEPLMESCQADCHGFSQHNTNQTMEEACGEISEIIIRGDENFRRLHQLWGDYILFASEEADSSSWCGQPGRSCVPCLTAIAGDDNDDDKCADRMVNSDLAASLTRLAKFVDAEWGDRKLLVREAWDEPTSEFPEGRHGNRSVFYEGRAALLTLTTPNPDTSSLSNIVTETDDNILTRFSELAVCSNFKQVTREEENNVLETCVAKKPASHLKKRAILSRNRRSGEVHHPSVKSILEQVGDATAASKPTLELPSELTEGTSFPPAISMERACGDVTGMISQDNVARMERLVEYPFDDVEFSPEGPMDAWCGVETRRCRLCVFPVDESSVADTWSWCGTRTMSMRLAIRLHRLSILTDGNVAVTAAHTTEPTSDMSNLYAEGRAARIELLPASTMTTQELTSYAKFAGFDYVSFSSPSSIEVCVKIQDGLDAQIVMFPYATLVAVPLPLDEQDEYAYPDAHAHETRRPLLFDNSTSSSELSEHFKLHMFLSPGKRFLRLDPILVDLLELAYDDLKDGFEIVTGSGYRSRSVNLDNIDGRHENETFRYQMGQAVEVTPKGAVNEDTLFRLGIALMKAGRTIQPQGYAIGIGAKEDRLYCHVRPLLRGQKAVAVWDSGNALLFERLWHVVDQVYRGGFIITAKTDAVVCATPILDFYFGFDLDQDGYCWAVEDDFCAETEAERQSVAETFERRLVVAAGSGTSLDISSEIRSCIINNCGGCPNQGAVWKSKVVSCARMILKYLSVASVPFQPLKDKVSIFNTENTNSSVHDEACGHQRVCVENTQIYSLLVPLLTATYFRDKTKELLFGGSDNPSPLLEIVEQELAWRAEGKVDVFIDGTRDISALRDVLKIIFTLNKKVTDVTIHIDPNINKNDVTQALQRKLEEWSVSVCPQWSREVVTPYTVEVIPHKILRRSIERSQARNKLKHSMHHWEVNEVLNY